MVFSQEIALPRHRWYGAVVATVITTSRIDDVGVRDRDKEENSD